MSFDYVLGFDLETTDLDLRDLGILEVGASVIAPDFKVLHSTSWVVNPGPDKLGRMCDAVRRQHEASGLLKMVETWGAKLQDIDKVCAEWIESCFGRERARLLGFSVWFDRALVRLHMPETEKRLSHHIIDVSSYREAQHAFDAPHRVLPDIAEAASTLQRLMGRSN